MMNQDTFWPAISILFLASVAAFWVLKRIKLRRARTWPTEAGQVDSTAVRLEQRGTYQSVYVAEVKYSYTVQGTTYSGRLRRTFMLKKSAEKWAGQYRSGLSLTVRYNPSKAKDSVLFEREQVDASRAPAIQ